MKLKSIFLFTALVFGYSLANALPFQVNPADYDPVTGMRKNDKSHQSMAKKDSARKTDKQTVKKDSKSEPKKGTETNKK